MDVVDAMMMIFRPPFSKACKVLAQLFLALRVLKQPIFIRSGVGYGMRQEQSGFRMRGIPFRPIHTYITIVILS
jgi:hypothetical protein